MIKNNDSFNEKEHGIASCDDKEHDIDSCDDREHGSCDRMLCIKNMTAVMRKGITAWNLMIKRQSCFTKNKEYYSFKMDDYEYYWCKHYDKEIWRTIVVLV